jgi:hypothetical protein
MPLRDEVRQPLTWIRNSGSSVANVHIRDVFPIFTYIKEVLGEVPDRKFGSIYLTPSVSNILERREEAATALSPMVRTVMQDVDMSAFLFFAAGVFITVSFLCSPVLLPLPCRSPLLPLSG